jgi:mRNA (guanine-N7-)-methyltransferase
MSSQVAQHYNKLQETGLAKRSESRIYYLRNFNNWIKSCLIANTVNRLRQQPATESPPTIPPPISASGEREQTGDKDSAQSRKRPHEEAAANGDAASAPKRPRGDGGPRQYRLTVLDMCSGKGGDLLKWQKSAVPLLHYVAVDIAEVSVQQARERYQSVKERNNGHVFTAEFHAADCSKTRIRDLFSAPTQFDIASCQFSIHYGFESQTQAECMVQNACESVKLGGYFIGTTTDAVEILRRVTLTDPSTSQSESSSVNGGRFGNDVFSLFFDDGAQQFPQFGCKYHFQLDGVVDCPEFLCHIKVLERLAAKHGFRMTETMSFKEAFERNKKNPQYKRLLSVIRALEPYHPKSRDLLSQQENDYAHAEGFHERCERDLAESNKFTNHHQRNYRPQFKDSTGGVGVGTLSKSDWEAISVYLCFVFKRVSLDSLPVQFEYKEAEVVEHAKSLQVTSSHLAPPVIDDYFLRKTNYS